jgi:hypothetical protein
MQRERYLQAERRRWLEGVTRNVHQLVYISTARHEIFPDVLREILAVSRTNNARVGVTGLLVAGGNRFLQVLEGPLEAVREIYKRIQQDQRHFALVVLTSRSVSARAFGDWSMAFKQGARASDGSLKDIVFGITENLSDPDLRADFRGFADLHSQAA